MTTSQVIQPLRPCNAEVSCRNHTSNISLTLLLETANELAVNFNPYYPVLAVDLNLKRWT